MSMSGMRKQLKSPDSRKKMRSTNLLVSTESETIQTFLFDFKLSHLHFLCTVSTFIMPDFQKSVQEVLDNALRGHERSNYELEFCTASEEIRYLLVNATTRRDAENNIVGVVGVVS